MLFMPIRYLIGWLLCDWIGWQAWSYISTFSAMYPIRHNSTLRGSLKCLFAVIQGNLLSTWACLRMSWVSLNELVGSVLFTYYVIGANPV